MKAYGGTDAQVEKYASASIFNVISFLNMKAAFSSETLEHITKLQVIT
jgi:hypothetical protein